MRLFPGRLATIVGAAGCALACNSAPQDQAGSGPSAASASSARAVRSASSADAAADSFPVPKASVDAVLNPAGLPAYDGPTGSVEGTVYVSGPAAPDVPVIVGTCRAALDTYGKLFREGKPARADGSRPLGDAVVVVVGYEGYYLPERSDAKRVTIGPACVYPARTITLTFGQRLEVANETSQVYAPKLEEVFSPALMVVPPGGHGGPVKLYPPRTGHFTLTDQMQPFVHEDLYVFRHPLHTVTATDGQFRLDGLPVGKLTVGAQHPGVGSDSKVVIDVKANVVQRVDLTLKYAPKPLPKPIDAGPIDPRLRIQ